MLDSATTPLAEAVLAAGYSVAWAARRAGVRYRPLLENRVTNAERDRLMQLLAEIERGDLVPPASARAKGVGQAVAA